VASAASSRVLQWGHAFSSVESTAVRTSPAVNVLLQWGHAFSSVESFGVDPVSAPYHSLQWGHAFSSVESSRPPAGMGLELIASMGPRFFKRGELNHRRDFGGQGMLQWGHAFSSVERPCSAFRRPTRQGLQWGHAFSSVERRPPPRAERNGPESFNGATLFQAWRGRRLGSGCCPA